MSLSYLLVSLLSVILSLPSFLKGENRLVMSLCRASVSVCVCVCVCVCVRVCFFYFAFVSDFVSVYVLPCSSIPNFEPDE